MATTRTRSRARSRGTNAQSMPFVAQNSATPARVPRVGEPEGLVRDGGERFDALRAGELGDRRDIGDGDHRRLEHEIHRRGHQCGRVGARVLPGEVRHARGLTRRAHSFARSRASSMSDPVASATPMRRFL